MKNIKRIILRWLGVNGDFYYPHRFVSMMYWRDEIIAVDGNGDIYRVSLDYEGSPIVQLWMNNPLEK